VCLRERPLRPALICGADERRLDAMGDQEVDQDGYEEEQFLFRAIFSAGKS